MSFSTWQRVKRKILRTERKQSYVMKNEKKKQNKQTNKKQQQQLWLFLLEQKKNDRSSLSFSSKLAGLSFPRKF